MMQQATVGSVAPCYQRAAVINNSEDMRAARHSAADGAQRYWPCAVTMAMSLSPWRALIGDTFASPHREGRCCYALPRHCTVLAGMFDSNSHSLPLSTGGRCAH
eukprot:TRINITY_DN17703_c0_g1_i1.p2 TRINITY_DN17703_c0_g1~~TRINITY_DN17703_c0_g1_i1.p2  ORF type:complete len:104 (-),score=4.33 TRINITY_DN17703_c0_g1_i1:476-787(-)